MADIDTWQGMAETAWAVIQDPTKADDVAIAVAQEFFATDKITGDNPARGIGEAGFNVATLFLPGGALSKTGLAAKGVNAARRGFGNPDAPAPDTAPTFGSHDLEGLDDVPGVGTRPTDVTDVRPGAIPDSVIGPVPPNGIDAPPANPRGVEAPAGPPDPPSPTGTPGGHEGRGDGGGSGPPPPPDPPERTPGPSDAGPGRAEGPPQSPASPGPGSADSPPAAPNQAPSPGDPTPPATPQAPESSGPTGQSEAGASRSDTGSPTGHTPAAPDAPAGGHAPEQHGGGTGVGENPAYQPGGNDAPSEGQRPGSDEHTARPDERAHTPADEQLTNSPAGEQPGGPERTGDDGQTREPAHAAGDNETKRHEPAGVMPVGMGGFGTPMTSHGSGSSPDSANGSAAAPKAATPDASTRNLDGAGPRAATPESPRAQQPGAAGPGAGNRPSAPVDATKQPTAGLAGDPRLRESADVARQAVVGALSSGIDAKNLDHSDASTGHSTLPDELGVREVADPVRSGEPAGEGWERLPDSFQDPAPSQPWPFTDNPVDPAVMNPHVARLIGDPAAPFGRDALGDPFTSEKYAEQFHKLGPEGQQWVNFPDNDGAVPNTKVAYSDFERFKRDYGNRFDRIGNAKGKYFGLIEEGRPATWEERAMHVSSLREPYKTFTLDHLPEGWKIEISQIAPGLGQPGGGLQVRIMDEKGVFQSVQQLATIDNGVIKVDKPS
jgi:hypothetical protein